MPQRSDSLLYCPVPSRLDVDASEIRLLTLLPGPFEADLRIDIDTTVLNKDHVPQFEALSYAWGSSETPAKLFISQKKRRSPRRLPQRAARKLAVRRLAAHRLTGTAPADARTLAVTQNLATALRYLRYGDRPRVLWIDAICVNQKNLPERSQQVARMVDIFSLSNRVVVWLGPESHDSALALKSLRNVGSEVKVDRDSKFYEAKVTTNSLISHLDIATWTSIFSLLSRRWFGRLWIWQEVRLAKEGAQVLCGQDSLSWREFSNAILFLKTIPKPAVPGIPSCKCVDRVHALSYPRVRTNLLNALLLTRHGECTDKRDKIYAVLNLVEGYVGGHLEADYSKTAYEVYQNLVLLYLEQIKSLDILRLCELGQPIADKPTWVPDLSSPNTYDIPDTFNASAQTKSHGEYIGSGILQVTGMCAAKISHVENILLPENPTIHEAAELVTRIAASVIKSDIYVGGGAMLDAMCRTLCCNELSDRWEPKNSTLPDYTMSLSFLHGLLNGIDEYNLELLVENRNYLNRVSAALSGGKFVISHDGYIGLAPRAVEPGDQICIVLGCTMLLILRPDEYGRHSVVGPCYVHGLMDGAALLGPLTRMWKNVVRYDTVVETLREAFHNQETGETQVEDPRKEPLPEGWQICRHEAESAFKLYLNQVTGKRTFWDPRVSPEALRARGVELQDFWLK